MTPDEREKLDSRLIDAAAQGDTQTAHTLLAAGASVHVRNDCALRWAPMHGHITRLNSVLQPGGKRGTISEWRHRAARFARRQEWLRCSSSARDFVAVAERF